MEAATVGAAGAARSKRVAFGSTQVGLTVAGAVIGVVGMFLKAFNTPGEWAAGGFSGSTTYISTTGGSKVLLGSLVVGLVFLLLAVAAHRRGVLWGTYVFAVVAIAIGAINAGAGFSISGSDVKAKAAIGVFVALAGAVIMFIGAIATRRSARPAP